MIERAMRAGRARSRLRRARAAGARRAASICWRSRGSRSSPSTRRIASRNGATISARNICSSRCCTSAFPRCRASPSPRPPTGRRARDIVERLRLGEARIFAAGFDRPNIRYRVVPKNDAKAQLLAFLDAEHRGDAGIVYCLSRNGSRRSRRGSRSKGRVALPYHAGLDAATRERNQDRFLKEEGVVIVATIAFGMGIDKPNVRFVAHLDAPKSLEAYYQETGRAGRDGLPANAWMTYGMADVVALHRLIEGRVSTSGSAASSGRSSTRCSAIARPSRCRRQVLLGYFGEHEHPPCGNCDNCLRRQRLGRRWSRRRRRSRRCSARASASASAISSTCCSARRHERIKQLGHDQLKTFGVGADLGKHELACGLPPARRARPSRCRCRGPWRTLCGR